MFSIDSLESRKMLATLIASQIGDTLELVGTGNSETLAILVDPVADALYVHGLDGTTVNQSSTSTFSGIQNLFVDLRGGENSLRIDSQISRKAEFNQLAIFSGKDNDTIILDRLQVTDELRVMSRSGQDYVSISKSSMGSIVLNTGDGQDAIMFHYNYLTGPSRVHSGKGHDGVDLRGNELIRRGRLTVATRSGDDLINVVDTKQPSASRLIVNGGTGLDVGVIEDAQMPDVETQFGTTPQTTFSWITAHPGFEKATELRDFAPNDVRVTTNIGSAVQLNGSPYSDRILIESDAGTGNYVIRGLAGTTINGKSSVTLSTIGNLTLSMRSGDDQVIIQSDILDNRSLGAVSVNLGAGNDYFEMLRQNAAQIFVRGEEGNDYVDIQLVNNNGADIDLGEGNDALDFFNNRVAGALTIHGKDGSDSLHFYFGQFINGPTLIDAGTENDFVSFQSVTQTNQSSLIVDGNQGQDTLNRAPFSLSRRPNFENFVDDFSFGLNQLWFHELHHVGEFATAEIRL